MGIDELCDFAIEAENNVEQYRLGVVGLKISQREIVKAKVAHFSVHHAVDFSTNNLQVGKDVKRVDEFGGFFRCAVVVGVFPNEKRTAQPHE